MFEGEAVRAQALAPTRRGSTSAKLAFAGVTMVVVLAVGMWALESADSHVQHPWDAAYFAVMSLTSIGFGDIYPRSDASKLFVVAVSAACPRQPCEQQRSACQTGLVRGQETALAA
jgi:hypothetical protein